MIAPKGRPVKQCEHCRSARKDKSHHAKCDCGSKKHKEPTESEPKLESPECCCHKGTGCACGIKSEMEDLRHETIARRRAMPVKSKPVLTTATSDPGLTIFANGHHKHKPVHNTHGQALVTPYPKPMRSTRPNSVHNPPYARNFVDALEYSEGQSRSVDDMSLLNNNSNKVNGTNYGAQLSADNLQDYVSSGDFATGIIGFDFQAALGNESDGSQLSRTTSAEALSVSTGWFDSSLSTVNEAPGEFSTSPNGIFGDADWSIPSATSDFFLPEHLPLTQLSDLQTVSHSGESNYQSAPGLTASSSGAQSEAGDPTDTKRTEVFPQWSGTVQILDSYRLSSASTTTDYAFPQSLPAFDSALKQKQKQTQTRHRQTYSSGSNSHHHSHHLSDSTTVPDDHLATTGVNIGHLQNLETLKNHRDALSASQSSSPEYPSLAESEIGSISIPASLDEASINDDWYFNIDPPQAGAQAREFSWLLDGA